MILLQQFYGIQNADVISGTKYEAFKYETENRKATSERIVAIFVKCGAHADGIYCSSNVYDASAARCHTRQWIGSGITRI